MARKQSASAAAGDTGTSTSDAKPTRTRDTTNALSLDTNQKAILLTTILDRPGQLSTRDLVAILAGNPAFAALATALAHPAAAEKIRQQVKKMAKAAAKRGVVIALKRVSGVAGDYESVVDQVLRARGMGGQVPVGPVASQPIPGPLAGGAPPGLIPVLPQGQ